MTILEGLLSVLFQLNNRHIIPPLGNTLEECECSTCNQRFSLTLQTCGSPLKDELSWNDDTYKFCEDPSTKLDEDSVVAALEQLLHNFYQEHSLSSKLTSKQRKGEFVYEETLSVSDLLHLCRLNLNG